MEYRVQILRVSVLLWILHLGDMGKFVYKQSVMKTDLENKSQRFIILICSKQVGRNPPCDWKKSVRQRHQDIQYQDINAKSCKLVLNAFEIRPNNNTL